MDKAERLLKKAALCYRLGALETWLAQNNYDLSKLEEEQLRLCVESLRLATSIRDIKKQLEELDAPHNRT